MIIKVLLVLFFLLIPNAIYREVISAESALIIKERNYNQDGHQAPMLILGNSHLMPLFKHDQKKIYNFATPSQDYIQTYSLLKYLLEHGSHSFHVVVLPLSVESFARGGYSNLGHAYFWGKYLDYLDLSLNNDKHKIYLLEFLQGKCFSYIGQLDKLLHYIKGNDIHQSERIIENRPRKPFDQLTPEKQEKLLRNRFKNLFSSNDLVIPQLQKYFFRTIDLCNKHKVTIVLVRTPITEKLNQKVIQELNIHEFTQAVKEILEKYPDIRYLDYQELAEAHDSWFQDPDHLNPVGAQKLTEMMIPELQKYQ